VKAESNCLAHALILTISRVTIDSNYTSYRKEIKYTLGLLETTSFELYGGVGICEHIK